MSLDPLTQSFLEPKDDKLPSNSPDDADGYDDEGNHDEGSAEYYDDGDDDDDESYDEGDEEEHRRRRLGNEDGGGGESRSSTDETDDLLKERDSKIASLERQRLKQDESLALLRSELGAVQIKHKEESYWLRLEVDNLRRDKEATEDRMAELYRDMREIDNLNDSDDPMAAPVCIDSSYVLHLQSQLSKSMQTMGVLDNQISMVKRSCDEVVKSLKEEISDVMDDKCRMEMELMNQLAVLDNEKRELEEEFEEQLRLRDETNEALKAKVRNLRKGIDDGTPIDATEDAAQAGGDAPEEKAVAAAATAGPPTAAFKERTIEVDLMKQIATLTSEKKQLEKSSSSERDDLFEQVSRLEESNADLEDRIETMKGEMDVMREGASAERAAEVLDAVGRDRQETLTMLERVALIWEKADDSIQSLEEIMDELRPYDNIEEDGQEHLPPDRERALSTLEASSLVHGQIKVSLLLVELKLRNQLTSLKNDKLRMMGGIGANGVRIPALGGAAPGEATAAEKAASVVEKAEEIQDEALAALRQVEENMSAQVEALEAMCHDESADARAALTEREDEIEDLRKSSEEKEKEVRRLKAEEERLKEESEGLRSDLERAKAAAEEAAAAAAAAAASATNGVSNGKSNAGGGEGGADATSSIASREVMEKLQREVISVVDRVKEKNETIGRLTAAIEEHKVREAALKKELKRMMKRVRAVEEDGGGGGSERKDGSKQLGSSSSNQRGRASMIRAGGGGS